LTGAAKAVKRLFMRGHDTAEETISPSQAQPGRVKERRTDIPLDLLEHAYTPADTSSKASFRSSGQDHHDDQEFRDGCG